VFKFSRVLPWKEAFKDGKELEKTEKKDKKCLKMSNRKVFQDEYFFFFVYNVRLGNGNRVQVCKKNFL